MDELLADDLYTGLSSADFTPGNESLPNEKVDEEVKAQKRQRNDLLPVAKDIQAYIRKEFDRVNSITEINVDKLKSGDDVLDMLRAKKLYLEYLKGFEAWMIARLATKPQKPKK